jgi:hypothetical protein
VQGLDNDNRIHRWTIEELEAIRLKHTPTCAH